MLNILVNANKFSKSSSEILLRYIIKLQYVFALINIWYFSDFSDSRWLLIWDKRLFQFFSWQYLLKCSENVGKLVSQRGNKYFFSKMPNPFLIAIKGSDSYHNSINIFKNKKNI